MDRRTVKIKEALERLYEKYNRHELIEPDPLQFVYRYSKPGDMEVAGFLAASLAYGRVGQIQRSMEDLLGRMGASPCEFVGNFSKSQRKRLGDFKHRFTTGDDIADMLELLGWVLREHGGIEKYFAAGYNENDRDIVPALSGFCESLLQRYVTDKGREPQRGLRYLLVRPSGGSACKRLSLFLRWMVRADDVDAGLWKSIDKSRLIVPMDVHMGRLTGLLGFHDHKTISLKTAKLVTAKFAVIDSNDPVKYDFALSRIGIVENCTGRETAACDACGLAGLCSVNAT